MVTLLLDIKDIRDVVKAFDTVDAPVVGPTLATLNAGVEAVVLEPISMPLSHAPIETDTGGSAVRTVISKSQFLTILVLVTRPHPSPTALTAAVYALSAAPSSYAQPYPISHIAFHRTLFVQLATARSRT